jgi:hypothetical protein
LVSLYTNDPWQLVIINLRLESDTTPKSAARLGYHYAAVQATPFGDRLGLYIYPTATRATYALRRLHDPDEPPLPHLYDRPDHLVAGHVRSRRDLLAVDAHSAAGDHPSPLAVRGDEARVFEQRGEEHLVGRSGTAYSGDVLGCLV